MPLDSLWQGHSSVPPTPLSEWGALGLSSCAARRRWPDGALMHSAEGTFPRTGVAAGPSAAKGLPLQRPARHAVVPPGK